MGQRVIMYKSVGLISLLTLLFAGCKADKNKTGVEMFPNMVHSVAAEAFSESSVTKDGKSMLEPVKGTIPRGFMPFNYGKGEAEAMRAGEEFLNPTNKLDKKLIARGKEVYTHSCFVCHGETGKGDGPLIPKFPNPPSFTTGRLKAFKDGRLYHVIVHGAGDMPSHSKHVLPEDRWALVNYIRELQK